MISVNELQILRSQKKIDEAYDWTKKVLEEGTYSEMLKNACGWVIYDKLKVAADSNDWNEYCLHLDELNRLCLSEANSMLFSSVCWTLRKMIDANCNCQQPSMFDGLFELIRNIPFPKSEGSYHALLSSALRIKDWNGINGFIEWWGIDNLNAEDKQPYVNEAGRKIPSLAERCNIVQCRSLIESGDKNAIIAFIPYQKQFVAENPSYQYPAYYLAKLCLAAGMNDDAIESLKPFARRKQKDFWVWKLLGDANSNVDDKMAFYSKAYLCGNQDKSYLVKLMFSLASVCHELGNNDMARALVDEVIAVKNAKGWPISWNVSAVLNEEWYVSATSRIDMTVLQQYAARADEFLFGKMDFVTVKVTCVSPKGFINFVTEDGKEGFFRKPKKGLDDVVKGDVVEIKVSAIERDKPTRVIFAKIKK